MGKSRKAKRDSSVAEEGSEAKRLRSEAHNGSSGALRLDLEDGDEVQFLGLAELTVERGCITIAGAHVKQGSPSLQLAADSQIGGALVIRAEASKTQTTVPLAASRSVATLLFTGTLEEAAHLQQQEGGSSPAGRSQNSSFQVTRRKEAHALTTIPEAWHAAVNSMEEAARKLDPTGCLRLAVAGSRGTGKSTIARRLVNALLSTVPCVAFLDTDLGQPEFTPAGMVSLSLLTQPVFGPPHLHQRTPEMSHFLGDVSPQGEPERYLQAVRSLYAWYCQCQGSAGQQQQPPLVVNTHGWIQGIGLQCLEDVLALVAPSHVVMLQSTSARKNLPRHPFWRDPAVPGQPQPQLLFVPAINSQDTDPGTGELEASKMKVLAPIDARGLAWLAFSRRCCGIERPPSEWDAAAFAAAAQLLTSQPPFAVPFSAIKVQVMHTCLGEAQLLAALNCSIVGLATSSGHDMAGSDGTEGTAAPHRCLGFGIVRSIDAVKGVLHILTDVEGDELEKVDVIQLGKLQLPSPLLQTVDKASPYLSFWSISGGGTGSAVIKSRNNLAREGQK